MPLRCDTIKTRRLCGPVLCIWDPYTGLCGPRKKKKRISRGKVLSPRSSRSVPKALRRSSIKKKLPPTPPYSKSHIGAYKKYKLAHPHKSIQEAVKAIRAGLYAPEENIKYKFKNKIIKSKVIKRNGGLVLQFKNIGGVRRIISN